LLSNIFFIIIKKYILYIIITKITPTRLNIIPERRICCSPFKSPTLYASQERANPSSVIWSHVKEFITACRRAKEVVSSLLKQTQT